MRDSVVARSAAPVLRGGCILVLGPTPVMERACEVLQGHGYEVRRTEACTASVSLLAELHPDLIITDLAFSDLHGAEACRHLRACSPAAILVVTAQDDEEACAQALGAGADDYFGRLCRTREFAARVGALLRRAKRPSDDVVAVGDIRIDVQTRDVTVANRRMRLWPHEFDLLLYLTRRPSTVQSHRALLAAIWGPSVRLRSHYVRMCVAHLRRRIEPTPGRPRYLLTERGIGYRLEPNGAFGDRSAARVMTPSSAGGARRHHDASTPLAGAGGR